MGRVPPNLPGQVNSWSAKAVMFSIAFLAMLSPMAAAGWMFAKVFIYRTWGD